MWGPKFPRPITSHLTLVQLLFGWTPAFICGASHAWAMCFVCLAVRVWEDEDGERGDDHKEEEI